MKNNLLQTLESYKFHTGRMIGWSKSMYRQEHPNDNLVFNANLVTKSGKQWYGDLNLTLDSEALQKVLNESGQTFLILREMDCRFDTENSSFEELEKKAVKIFAPES